MPEYCEMCGEELNPEDEVEGICENCKIARDAKKIEEDEDYVDPGVT